MSYLDWHVGMKVVCVIDGPDVRASGCRWADGEAVVEGQVYTLTRIFTDSDGNAIVWLREVERSPISKAFIGDEAGYGAWRFRPVQTRKTDISIFTAMLDGAKERERA